MRDGPVSKYCKIRDALLVEIKSGVFDVTGRLPGEHDLALRFGTARETLRRAILELERLGLVRRKKGAGTFVVKRGGCRSGVVALLFPSPSVARIFGAFSREIASLAKNAGHRVVLHELEAGTKGEAAIRMRRLARELVLQNPDGVIFRPLVDERFSDANQEFVRILCNAHVPVVLVDSDVVGPPARSACDLVAVDNILAGRRVAEHLYRTGRRKVAFMTNGSILRNNANWRNRLFGVAGELALLKVRDAVRPLDFKPHDVRRLKGLWTSGTAPDAIVCGNDETALAVVESLTKIGKRIPRDVAVVGFDDADVAASGPVPLTTVHQPVRQIARAAFQALAARIAGTAGEPRVVLLEAPLVVRQST